MEQCPRTDGLQQIDKWVDFSKQNTSSNYIEERQNRIRGDLAMTLQDSLGFGSKVGGTDISS